MKSRRMRWVKHVARIGRGEMYTVSWWEHLKGRDHWGNQGVDGRIILGQIFRKWDEGIRTGLSWLRVETGGGHL
jgi:hypothetical protein